MKTFFTKYRAFAIVMLVVNLFLVGGANAQTTVFTDNFNRATLNPGGTPSMTYTSVNTGTGSSAISGSAFLQISNGGTAGRSYVRGPLSTYNSLFNATLASNTGIITWTFNMRYARTTAPSGFDNGNYGIATVLAADGTDWLTANGYAIVYGGTEGTKRYKLVRFAAGLDANANVTEIIANNAAAPTNVNDYVSIRVTYDPIGNNWALFFRNDGTSAWADPSSGVTTQIGSTTSNSTYTTTAMNVFGFLWNYSTAGSQFAQYDNFSVTVATTPFLNVLPTSLAFGSQAINTNSLSQTFNLIGANLQGFPSTITVNAPSQFEVSNDNSTWGASTTISYTSATLAATPVYVRFSPTSTGAKTGDVTFTYSGGGTITTSPTVALTGTCPAPANTKVWNGGASGNWNTAGSWSPSGVPAAGDVVTFNTPATIACAVDVNTAAISSLTFSGSVAVTFTSSGGGRTITLSNAGTALNIQNGSSVTLKGSSGSGTRSMDLVYTGTGNTTQIAGTLTVTDVLEGSSYDASNSTTTVTGTLKNDGSTGGTAGTITSAANNLIIASGGTYLHALDAGTIPTAKWDAASNCKITGTTTTIPGGQSQAFGNFEYDCNQTGSENFAPTSIAGNLALTNISTTSTNELRLNVSPLTIGGNLVLSAGTFNIATATSRTLNVTGNVSITGGIFLMSEGSGIGTLNVTGNFSHTAGTINENSSGSGLIVFNKSGTQTFTSGGTVTNTIGYTVNSGSTLQMAATGTTVNGGGLFTLSSGASLGITSTEGITTAACGTGATCGNIRTTTRTYDAAANYTYNGTGGVQASGNGLTTANNLTADNPAGVNIGTNVTVNGTFLVTNTGTVNVTGGTTTFGASATMTVNPLATFKVTSPGTANFADKSVTVKSDATGTGSIGSSTGTINNATNVTVERYTNDKRAWRLLSVPTSGQTIKQAWMENAANAASNPNPNFGTHITTFTGDANAANFDAVKPSSSIRTFANPGSTWSTTPNTTSAINAEQGYMLFVRGNRTVDLNDITAHTAATLRITGTLKQGTQSAVSVPYSATDYTLVGNPFASPIDYEYLFNNTTNLSASFYVWDANLAGTYAVGGYRLVTRTGAGTYQQTPAGGSAAANNTMRYIHSGQAFLANAAAAGSASLIINEASKATSVSDIFPFTPTTIDEEMTINMSSVETDLSVNLSDGIRSKYNIAYDAAVTAEDNRKLNNFNENLGITRDGENLIVERRPVIGTTDTTYLRISNMKQKNYQLDINTTNLDHTNLLGKIVDNFTASSSPLDLNGNTIFNFTVTADPASYAADRLKIVFYIPGPLPVTFTSIKAVQQNNDIAVEWKVENQTNIKQYEVEKSIDGRSFTKVATQIATGANGSAATYNWLDVNTVNGDNFYRVRSIGLSGDVQYTKIVKLRMGKGVPAITVYPNPVTDRVMTIQFTDMPAGNYTLSLVNPLGQIVQTRQITHTGANAVQTMSIERGVAGGNYQLQVIKPGGEKEVLKLLITE